MFGNAPNYKARAQQRIAMKAKARERERLAKGRHLHYVKVGAELVIDEGFAAKKTVISAQLVMNELTPKGTFLFVSHQLPAGIRVAIRLQEPDNFYVRGVVVSSAHVALEKHVISTKQYPYRVGIQFEFQSEKEKQIIARFSEAITEKYVRKKAA